MGYLWDPQNKNTYDNRSGHYKYNRELTFILKSIQEPDSRILDIAGGSGRFAIPLQKLKNHLTVIDINNEAIEILKNRSSDIKSICADFTEIDLTDKYSYLLCIEALGYFRNWPFFFQKAHNLLTKDGRLILTYTNPQSWRFRLRKIRSGKKSTDYNYMKWSEFKQLITKAGFDIESCEGMNWIPLPLTSNSIFVNVFSLAERILRLNRWHNQSPWILVCLKKSR